MLKQRFEALVSEALEGLPAEFHERLENIDVVIEDWPTPSQLAQVGLRYRTDLLGLYQGVPVTERGGHYGSVVPDKITIFQKPIEAMCNSDEEMGKEVQDVVYHEIAHHFGFSDEHLEMIQDEKLDNH